MSGFDTARVTSVEQAIRSGRAPDASAIADLAGGVELGADGSAAERQRLRESVLGLGPLASWVARPDVTDVVVNGDGRVWVDRGAGMEDTGVELDAAGARSIIERIGPIVRVALEAAASDPELAVVMEAVKATRRTEMAESVGLLAGPDGVLEDEEEAAATLYVLYSPQVAQILTEHLGWSYDRYETWLADAIERLVLND